ncbi:MAG: hypothetical protein GY856_42520 [bacterium]|nr:hypothetical protein [bacterium]
MRRLLLLTSMLLLVLTSGCLRKMAINTLADALAASGDVYASDDDPELVRDALPFALKTIDTLLVETPDHQGLRLAACQGYTQYAYAFVELEATRLEPVDYRGANKQRDRALKLYLRARDHCFHAVDLVAAGTSARLPSAPEEALDGFGVDDVPLLYWTGASWGAAMSLGLDRPELVADRPVVRALLERALKLDPDWSDGALHEAMIALDGLPATMGGSLEQAREHYERALELSGGNRPGPYVMWANAVSVRQQDREEFEDLLRKALAVDPDRRRSERLRTLITQERARLLLEQADELFLDDLEDLNDPDEET